MVGTTKPQRLPEDPSKQKEYANEVLADLETTSGSSPTHAFAEATEVRATIDDTWVKARVPDANTSVRLQMTTVLTDPDSSGYSDSDFELREWVDLTVEGDDAMASFIGVERFKRNPNRIVPEPTGWVSDHEKQFDLVLVREDGAWKISTVSSRRTDGIPGY